MTEKQPEPSKTSKEENKEEKRIPEHQQKLGPPPRRTENFPKWLEYHNQKWKMQMEKRIGPTASLKKTKKKKKKINFLDESNEEENPKKKH